MYSTDTEIKLDVITRELRQEEEDKRSQEQQNQTLSQEQDDEVEEEEEVYDAGVDTEDFNPMDSFIELPWPPSQWY